MRYFLSGREHQPSASSDCFSLCLRPSQSLSHLLMKKGRLLENILSPMTISHLNSSRLIETRLDLPRLVQTCPGLSKLLGTKLKFLLCPVFQNMYFLFYAMLVLR